MSEWQNALDNYQNGVQSVAQDNLQSMESVADAKIGDVQAQTSTLIGKTSAMAAGVRAKLGQGAMTAENLFTTGMLAGPQVFSGYMKFRGSRAAGLRARAANMRDLDRIDTKPVGYEQGVGGDVSQAPDAMAARSANLKGRLSGSKSRYDNLTDDQKDSFAAEYDAKRTPAEAGDIPDPATRLTAQEGNADLSDTLLTKYESGAGATPEQLDTLSRSAAGDFSRPAGPAAPDADVDPLSMPNVSIAQADESVTQGVVAPNLGAGPQAAQTRKVMADYQNTADREVDFGGTTGKVTAADSDPIDAQNEQALKAVQDAKDATNAEEAASGGGDAAAALEGEATAYEGVSETLSAAAPWLAGVAAIGGLAESLYQEFKTGGDSNPYAKIQGQVDAANKQTAQLTANISSDQFASKIGAAAPRYGSLAAPQMDTASQPGVALHV